MAGVGISNDGGFLVAENLEMSGVEMTSGVTGTNAAITSLFEFSVTDSSLQVSLFRYRRLNLSPNAMTHPCTRWSPPCTRGRYFSLRIPRLRGIRHFR